jgi:CRP/FNR family cyclic AMP-dependent transcriptional regulator
MGVLVAWTWRRAHAHHQLRLLVHGGNTAYGHNSEIVGRRRPARLPRDKPKRVPRMSMLSNLDLIRRVPLFSLLTNEQAQAIADSVVKRRFRRGELVVEQGRKSNALFILLNGRARVLTADQRGREVILAVLESGDYVGEMSLIDNEPHSATVRAEIQTDMLILGRAEFARCLPENSSLSYAILRGLVTRLRSADRQIESLALLDVYGRVARALLDMAEDVDGIKLIRNKVSRQDMAKIVGASREMVSRVMKDLEERGVIETQENGSVILKERIQTE